MGRAGLPNFTGLASRVLENLGSRKTSEERRLLDAMNWLEDAGLGGAVSADRIFSVLEKSFDQPRIASAVAEVLRPPEDVDLSCHGTILRLSTQRNGRVRLITTNFDRLFEKCAPSNVPSLSRSSLPRVSLGNTDWGILHLHGKLNADLATPDQDGLILSSGDFGDAYLANGWARDFVQEILERFAAVFIGYAADDPPVRYLLEGLQRSDGPSPRLYAFQDGPEDEAIAKWSEKGVTAIAYDVDEGDHSHSHLYETLNAWAVRAADPVRWRNRVFRRCSRGPQHVLPHERGMIAHIVRSRQGATAFSNHEPTMSPEWLGTFDPAIRYQEPGPISGRFSETPVVDPFARYGLDSDPPPPEENEAYSRRQKIPDGAWDGFAMNPSDREDLGADNASSLRGYFSRNQPRLPARVSALATWIGRCSRHPATVWWAARQEALHPDLIDIIRRRVADSDSQMRRVVQEAWRRLFEVLDRYSANDLNRFAVERSLAANNWAKSELRAYGAVNRVGLRLEHFYQRILPPKGNEKIKLRDLVQIKMDFPERTDRLVVPEHALADLIEVMRPNIEEAIDISSDYREWLEISPINEPDDESGDHYERDHGLSGYVLRFASIFNRLATHDPDLARAEYLRWRR